MNRDLCREKIKEIANNIHKDIIQKAEALMTSGVIKMNQYDNTMALPKLLVMAAIESIIERFPSEFWLEEDEETLRKLRGF